MAEDFVLDPSLVKDTLLLVEWPLCRVLLMNDARYPWLILVPRRAGLRELHDLALDDRALAMAEIDRASRALQAATGAHKMNVAALGNVTPQLHIHIIARFREDAAWPRPVWGLHPPLPYDSDALAHRSASLRNTLATA